jgi:hypothetical protein
MFADYSEVTDDMLELREIVMARKEPRKLLVQPNMVLTPGGGGGGVELKTYSASPAGMIASWGDRFQADIPDLFSLVEGEGARMENRFVDDLLA